ncbi:MAG TPA: hypothetical protein VFP29_09315, partial [Methyloceanibacter sp.]|nr:hypothetical protein [Methyloceanibacter sp.]
MRLVVLYLPLLSILAIQPALAQTANGITEKDNRRLHQALQPFVVPPDLAHVELSSDAPVGND